MKFLRALWTAITPPGRIAIGIGLLILLAMCAGCATTSSGDLHITVKADRVTQCHQQGGCALFTQGEVLQMIEEAIEADAKAAIDELDSHGCRRGST
jgi:hypothetical protein